MDVYEIGNFNLKGENIINQQQQMCTCSQQRRETIIERAFSLPVCPLLPDMNQLKNKVKREKNREQSISRGQLNDGRRQLSGRRRGNGRWGAGAKKAIAPPPPNHGHKKRKKHGQPKSWLLAGWLLNTQLSLRFCCQKEQKGSATETSVGQ